MKVKLVAILFGVIQGAYSDTITLESENQWKLTPPLSWESIGWVNMEESISLNRETTLWTKSPLSFSHYLQGRTKGFKELIKIPAPEKRILEGWNYKKSNFVYYLDGPEKISDDYVCEELKECVLVMTLNDNKKWDPVFYKYDKKPTATSFQIGIFNNRLTMRLVFSGEKPRAIWFNRLFWGIKTHTESWIPHPLVPHEHHYKIDLYSVPMLDLPLGLFGYTSSIPGSRFE